MSAPAPSAEALNPIGDDGATALAAALRRRGLEQLEVLDLGSCNIGDDGIAALSAALRSGACPLLHALDLRY